MWSGALRCGPRSALCSVSERCTASYQQPLSIPSAPDPHPGALLHVRRHDMTPQQPRAACWWPQERCRDWMAQGGGTLSWQWPESCYGCRCLGVRRTWPRDERDAGYRDAPASSCLPPAELVDARRDSFAGERIGSRRPKVHQRDFSRRREKRSSSVTVSSAPGNCRPTRQLMIDHQIHHPGGRICALAVRLSRRRDGGQARPPRA